MRGWNQTRRCYCLCWTIVAYILKIWEVTYNVSVFSMPYFGQLYSSRLKDLGRTEVYVHTSKWVWPTLSQRIVAKKWFLYLTKTLGRPWILHTIQNLICFNSSEEKKKKKKKKKKSSRWPSSTHFRNINKFHTDWTVCDKAIRSQAIIIK